MSDYKKRTTKFNKENIEKLPNDKPVVYKILDKNNKNVYTGKAKRGRVKERLIEHLNTGQDPIKNGVKVIIEQKSTISEAGKTEKRIISKVKPKNNKQGK